jgi:hypothetical protein
MRSPDISPATERSPLLDTQLDRTASYEPDEEATELDDEPIDVLMNKFGSPGGTLGLSGGIGVFGSSLTRRSSMTFSSAGLSRVPSRAETVRRRSSQPSSATRKQRPALFPDSPLHKTPSRVSTTEDAPLPIAEESENHAEVKAPMYQYGVSRGRYWACFLPGLSRPSTRHLWHLAIR